MNAPLRLAGYAVIAAGFTTITLERAVQRALEEGVRLVPDRRDGAFIATRPGGSSSYLVTADACTCPAGMHGQPCKHRALVLLVSAILDRGGMTARPPPLDRLEWHPETVAPM